MKAFALLVAGVLVWHAPMLEAQRAPEPYRPAFHFTPQRNWMNDPNGMVYYEGEWHLFFQYNPFGDTWGHMSWGHAVSRDMMHWTELPVALAEEDGVMIFSGSAVVDWKNTSGFGKNGKPPLVALYTGHREGRQDQRVAYSNDRGRTWTKAPGGPVLDLQLADFRDPKVFWDAKRARWVMVVSLPNDHRVQFYTSPNLRAWTLAGSFGPAGAANGQWECPDLFPVQVEGGGTKWVLIININPGGPAGGSGSQYFVGDFDGSRFVADSTTGAARWADYGADFYAGVSWSDVPARDGRRVWLGWMSNWSYAQQVPTAPWRSAMTLPRALTLRRTPDGLRLVQTPVRELAALAQTTRRFAGGSMDDAMAWLSAQGDLPPLLDVEVTLTKVQPSASFIVHIQTGPDGEGPLLTIDAKQGTLTLDRRKAGEATFHATYSTSHQAPLRVVGDTVTLRLVLDRGSMEVFAQRGETVMTDLIFPSTDVRAIHLAPLGEAPRVHSIVLRSLRMRRSTQGS